MPKRLLLLLLFAPMLFTSCKTDFEVNDKWKEIHVVYALLNARDTVHYIRVEKAFLNDNTSAYTIAQNEDSLYSQDSLSVKLTNVSTGVSVDFIRIHNMNKDSGLFASGQYLYRNPGQLKLDPRAIYELKVINTKTGVTSFATTELVDSIIPGAPKISPVSGRPPVLNFQKNVINPFYFIPGRGAKFYDINMVIHYKEYPNKDTTKPGIEKTLNWPIFTNYVLADVLGGDQVNFYIKGNDFYTMLLSHIPVDYNVLRRLGNIDVQISGGGEEIYNYMEVYKPAIGVVQKKPDYSNINNGIGIFSSRSYWHLSCPVSKSVTDLLYTDDNLKALNFLR